eukprot:TRINITY_DN1613_c0_g1_i2.p1 TRINITY_DN1613_c0_g1~~TRINITY_DN1613_c0_g1_i2.p1  ORF type:complete len:671 (-),score=134.95 TRINITY_DN1613_c0_g1_i2:2168-4180(-)
MTTPFVPPEYRELVDRLVRGLDIQDRKYHFRTYKKCFIGSEAARWMVVEGVAPSLEDAVVLGNILLNAGVFFHVTRDHPFKNEELYYRFAIHEEGGGHGSRPEGASGSLVSWGDFASPAVSNTLSESQPMIDPHTGAFVDVPLEALCVAPMDSHNTRLLDNVHPPLWQNPSPATQYNMVVIGAGAGGLVTAAGSAGVGAKVAIIEEHLLGGDCLNVGCVPSKALIRAAKSVASIRNAAKFGVELTSKPVIRFDKIMERMRKLRADISKNDSADRFSKLLGVDVFIGRGVFTSSHTIEVNGQVLEFSKACIATGAKTLIPDIPGIQDVKYLTNATVFNLTLLPPRLAVIGSGAVGCELAQSFARFGSDVKLFFRSDRILDKEEEDASKIVEESLKQDGVSIFPKSKYIKIYTRERDLPEDRYETLSAFDYDPVKEIVFVVENKGRQQEYVFDAVLLATGKAPNVVGLGLETAGVEYDRKTGVKVNDYLQTTAGHIYAVGDVCSPYKFTHVADFMARIVIRNALFLGHDKFSGLIIPWCTYTEPEVAHVGLYEADLKRSNTAYAAYSRQFHDVDRAILDGETEGYVRIICKEGTDIILGATVVGEHAGDMISEITLAMKNKVGLGAIATVIHPYPTQAEAIRQTGDAFNRTRLTPSVKTIFRGLMSAQRGFN